MTIEVRDESGRRARRGAVRPAKGKRRYILGAGVAGSLLSSTLAPAANAQQPGEQQPGEQQPGEQPANQPPNAQPPANAPANVEEELSELEEASESTAPAEAPPGPEAAAPPQPAGAAAPPSDATIADQPSPAPEAAPAPAQPREEIDEVIVTADRRRKDLQDYSGTAAAFSEARLRNVGITDVRDMSVMVPGLQIGTQESGTTVYIRGIGSDNNTELGDPAVAVHFDGVYLPRSRGLGSAFFDIERVEVNSGPQGTLRGRNAVGGAINIVSKQPVLNEIQANAEATFGTYNQRTYQGMINLPIFDTMALRVAARTNTRDATWDNARPVHDIPGAQEQNDWAGRATLRWQPSPQLDITVAYDYLLERGTGYLGANVITLLNRTNDNGTPEDLTDDFLDPVDPNSIDDPRRIYQRGITPSLDTTHQGVRLNAVYDAGPC